jgi:hypothetical protein
MRWWLGIALFLVLGGPARADNSACWGDGVDEPGRPDISCTELAEELLINLEGANLARVVGAMNAPGLPDDDGVLHYVSNYSLRQRAGAGVVDLRFGHDGKVEVINAVIDNGHGQTGIRFVWNGTLGSCSDFPGSIQRCDNRKGAPRPLGQQPDRSKGGFWGRLSRWLGD